MSTITYYNTTSTLLPPTGTSGTATTQMNVFGLFGSVTNVSVGLVGVSHTFTDDLDFLLVAPNNVNNLVFLSDAGGGNDFVDTNLTFSDGATDVPTDTGVIPSGTYKPTDYAPNEVTGDFTGATVATLNHAAPLGGATFASSFSGLIAPNGVWTLFIDDDVGGDSGSLDAWNLTVTSTSDIAFVAGTASADVFFVGNGAVADSGLFSLNGDIASFSGVKQVIFEGGNGDDSFFGGLERDNASGGADDDFLSGGDRKDKLFGDAGNDTLLGGNGNDTLVGGLGVDLMIGGADKDRFRFVTTDDSGIDALTRDLIEGFKRGEDRIDLSAIDARTSGDPGNDKFSSEIEKSNSFDGQGRIIYRTFNPSGTANDRTIISINTDNDAAAEMTIRLKGIHNLTASDFIL